MATLKMAEHITPRITCVRAIRRWIVNANGEREKVTVGWTSRCDCGRREDHLYLHDGNKAYDRAKTHALTHKCPKNATPWAGHLVKDMERD